MGKHEPRGKLQLSLMLYRTQILKKPIKTVSTAVIPYSSMVNCPNLGTLTQGLHCGLQQAAKLFNLNAFKRKTFPEDGQTRGRFLKGGITLFQG